MPRRQKGLPKGLHELFFLDSLVNIYARLCIITHSTELQRGVTKYGCTFMAAGIKELLQDIIYYVCIS